jgi:hypothetical protein
MKPKFHFKTPALPVFANLNMAENVSEMKIVEKLLSIQIFNSPCILRFEDQTVGQSL